MLRITGDINFTDGFFDTGFGVGSSIKSGADPFANIERKDSDFWFGNFECVCSSVSDKKGIYRRQFIISPDDMSHIRHFDLYGVANNHVMQHGCAAYENMLDYLERSGCLYVGSMNRKSVIIGHQGKKIGIIAFSLRPENFSETPLYWSMPEYTEIEYELGKLSGCDFRIAYVHWGNEFINYPYADQKNLARLMIDKGADMVIGMHPHVLQGVEIYKNKHIFYSLGNFVFNMVWIPTKYSAIVNVDFKNSRPEISWNYTRIRNDYFPICIDSEEVPAEYHFKHLNSLINICEENELYYTKVFENMKRYRKSNYIDILHNSAKFSRSDLYQIFRDFIRRKLS